MPAKKAVFLFSLRGISVGSDGGQAIHECTKKKCVKNTIRNFARRKKIKAPDNGVCRAANKLMCNTKKNGLLKNLWCVYV